MMEIEDSEIDEAVSFHNAEYGTKRTSKQWLWEYRGNYPELSVFVVIKDKERIVGTQGMIPIYLNVKGRKCLSGKSENTLLKRECRGRGLFTRLYDFALARSKDKGMCCVWGFTSVPNAIKLLKRLGFVFYSNVVSEVILFLNIRKYISSILISKRSIGIRIAKSFLVISIHLLSRGNIHVPSGKTSEQRQFSIEQKLRQESDVGNLYERLRKEYPNLIYIEQDGKFLFWRVFNNPNFRFATYFVYEQNLLRAYCYVSLANPEDVYISDLTFENGEAGDYLVEKVIEVFRKRSAASIAYMGNTQNQLIKGVLDLLKKHGFFRFGSESFVLKNLSTLNTKCLDVENWYLNGLWREGYTL